MCLKFNILDQCLCPDYLKDDENKVWIDKLIAAGHLEHQDNTDNADCMEVTKVTALYPSYKKNLASSPERVFCTAANATDSFSRAWFFYVTSNSTTRWLALDGLYQLKGETAGFVGILRGKGCCIRCACRAIMIKSFALL